jgi:hemerythrin-like domain-containing protein
MRLAMSASFCDLLELHGVLEDLFLLHQEALLLLDVEAARDLLASYRELLALHMHHEETVVLPLFERAGPVKKWPVVLYTGQHDKMRAHLEAIEQRISALSDSDPDRRAVLALLDAEATYKHLEEHHDGAERDGLFPITDGAVAESERAGVIHDVLAEWRSAHARLSQDIAKHRDALALRGRRLLG